MLPCLQTSQLAVSGHQTTSFVGGMLLLLERSELSLHTSRESGLPLFSGLSGVALSPVRALSF